MVTFDEVCDVVILTNERSINGPLDAELLLHKLGVTVQVGVGLSNAVHEQVIVLGG